MGTAMQRLLGGAEAREVFSTESEFVARILELLPSFLYGQGHGWSVALEVGVGAVIADIVVAIWKRPLKLRMQALSLRECVILAGLRRRGPTRIDLLEGACGMERGALREGELGRLLEIGLVARRPGGLVTIAHPWAARIQLIAIEAKLVEWKRALGQARVYAGYADQAYVAMPESAAPALRTKQFADARVGLLTVERGNLFERVAANRFKDHDWRREFALSRVLAKGSRGERRDVGPA